jgi:hypothetical protein
MNRLVSISMAALVAASLAVAPVASAATSDQQTRMRSTALGCETKAKTLGEQQPSRRVAPRKCYQVFYIGGHRNGDWGFRKAKWSKWTRNKAKGKATFFTNDESLGRLKMKASRPQVVTYPNGVSARTYTKFKVRFQGKWTRLT